MKDTLFTICLIALLFFAVMVYLIFEAAK